MSSENETSFPILRKTLKGTDIIVFFDVEGTQFSHKMISIGLVGYKTNGLDIIGEPVFSYHSLVKCDDEIGPVVMKMTGITSDLLQSEGKDVRVVIDDINRLLRPYRRKFISYGDQDMKMVHESLDPQDVTEMNFFRNMMKNHLDFHAYLEKRVCDRNGQSYSIERLLRLFHLESKGAFHDPLYDALDLAVIYHAYVSDEKRILELYLENYMKNPYQGTNNKKILALLLEKKQISISDLNDILKENL